MMRLKFILSVFLLSGWSVAAETYQWRNVEIGGGGFVTGVVFHPTERGLAYARTDVGGAYRLDDRNGRWIPLNDDIGGHEEDFQYLGVAGIGLDPSDARMVHLITGQYIGPEDWKVRARLYRSSDRGETWLPPVELPFKVAGNGEGRGAGEPLVVDPQDGKHLLLGTPDAGLWQSTDGGTTWSRNTGFPQTTVTFVMFRPGGRQVFAAANTLKDPGLWTSDDAGKSWRPVPGQPDGMFPIHGAFDSKGDFYTTWGDAIGPNHTPTRAGVWKLSAEGKWTDITPPRGQGGFSGVSADPRQPGHVLVATLHRWGPGDEIFRSTDGGANWSPVLAKTKISTASAPWAATCNPHWITDVEIDPFDSNRAFFNTGYGLFSTRTLDSGGNIEWTFTNAGLEELVPLSLFSPAEGPELVSVVMDYTGFVHDDVRRSPAAGRLAPENGSNQFLSGAALVPRKLLRQNEKDTLLSSDGGATWRAFASSPETARNGSGRAVLSADGKRILWCPKDSAPFVSSDDGASWQAVDGVSAGNHLQPIVDEADGMLLYVWHPADRCLYRSVDGGRVFTRTTARLNEERVKFRAVPGMRGHLWASQGLQGSLIRSTDAGDSFSRFDNLARVRQFGFGRAAKPGGYPAVFIWGSLDGTESTCRSDDAGKSWIRINDERHRYGGINDITGDPKIFGRVYLATSGRGIVYGDLRDTGLDSGEGER